ncbi:MAG: hypothetical protein HUJ87_14950 [Fusobacterium varium]|uniref:hypothetical protein n=1 Tax=Fusobacterium varium TaxID=856 RepID=UPI00243124FD|nr:hypothetical protein [Fusobacterium varium]MCF0171790.1 hypothetical protein [Fusobacterium varium]
MIEKICFLIQKEIDKYIKKNKITHTEFAKIAGIPSKSFANIICRLKKNVIPGNTALNKIEKVLKNK